ncbi:MAG: lipase maturation factor family protein [Myxococcaceae bacterium]
MANSYWLARFWILRLLGFVYLMAFSVFVFQGIALVGHHGLLPADTQVHALVQQQGAWGAFFSNPTLFVFGISDRAMLGVAIAGAVISLLAVLGFSNAITWFLNWALYMSLDHVGQLFWGYGWENQLLETGFLAIFFCPLLDPRPFPARAPPLPLVWLFRWLTFRVMLGAGLIKLRGDSCWRDLTCLDFHFETQPVPNPLSPWFHHLPHWAHALGVGFNHGVEVVVPFLLFAPKQVRRVAGALVIAFQCTLIVSGNLSFLNWLTLIPAIACFDDELLSRFTLPRMRLRVQKALLQAEPSRAQQVASWSVAALVAVLSVEPVLNLLSKHQAMNTSFGAFELVNTYGAFGSVGRERNELVLEGTRDADPATARWTAYDFKCKPGDPKRAPCWMSPYHYRVDWQIWFSAMGPPDDESGWLIHLIWKLLHNDEGALGLLAGNPFPGEPPRFIRVRWFRYHLQPYSAPTWWTREELGEWLPPLSKDDQRLTGVLEQLGFLPEP